jgi:hypothetical protein
VDAHTGGREPRRQVRKRRRCVERDLGVDGGGHAVRAQPRPHELRVVVAGHEHDLAVAGERPQHRLGGLHRLDRPSLGQLDDVAEQDEPVGAVQRL